MVDARARADAARQRMLAEKQRAAAGGPLYEDAVRREAVGEARRRDRAFREAAADFSAAAELFAKSAPSPEGTSPSVAGAQPLEAQADEEIRNVLGLYARAFATKNLKLLQQIRPRIRPDELSRHRQVFEQTRSYQLNLKIDAIRVIGDGAEASGRREDIVLTKDGQTVQRPDDFLFRLKRSNNHWTIDAVK